MSRLNNTVPTSCKPLLHQSMRCGSKVTIRNLRERASGPSSALIVSSHCSVAAEVKKIDPTKNTMPSTPEPTSCTKPGNGPIRKQADPKAKSTPIHHDTRLGAHQTPA